MNKQKLDWIESKLQSDVGMITQEHLSEAGEAFRQLRYEAAHNKLYSPNYHPKLHLLAVERTGWRRYVFGRWVYSDEPFRRDIQRRCADIGATDDSM